MDDRTPVQGGRRRAAISRRRLLRATVTAGLGMVGLAAIQACTPAAPAPSATQPPGGAAPAAPDKPTAAPPSQPTAAAAKPTAAGASQPTAAPAAKPAAAPAAGKPGGVVTFGTAQDFPSLDPHVASLLNQRNLFTLLWNGLVRYDETMQVQPDLAEKWEIVDPKTFVFTLRKGVKFHNGRELTAEDVKFSIERVQNPDTKSRYVSSVEKIGSVDVVDTNTVKLNLSQPNVIQHHELVDVKIVPKEAAADLNAKPVGTGPYQFAEFVPGDHVTLKRFDGYWQQPFPNPTEFTIKIVKDDTSLYNAFKAGQFDLIWQLRFEDTQDTEASNDLWVISPKISGNSMILQVDCSQPPFDNKLARQALLYATDKETIFDLAYFKLGWLSPTNSSLVPNHWAFNSSLTTYPYDIQKAKELFKAAGVTDGYTIRYNTISGLWRSWIVQGEILERSLRECGIKLEVRPVDLAEWSALRAPGKQYPNLVNPNGNERAWDPAEQLKGFRCQESRSRVYYCNREVDALMDQGLAETDQEKRKAIYAKVQEIVAEDVPWITTHHRPLNHAAWNHIKGVFVDGQGDLHLDKLSTEK